MIGTLRKGTSGLYQSSGRNAVYRNGILHLSSVELCIWDIDQDITRLGNRSFCFSGRLFGFCCFSRSLLFFLNFSLFFFCGRFFLCSKLFFYNSELTQEKGGFTMYTGDEALTITASAYPADTFANASFTWRTDDPDCLQLTPSEDGKSCEVAILQAKAGGTKLYASCYGVEYWVPVYLIQRN